MHPRSYRLKFPEPAPAEPSPSPPDAGSPGSSATPSVLRVRPASPPPRGPDSQAALALEPRELWIAAHLPHLPLLAVRQPGEELPLVVVDAEDRNQRIVAADARAQAEGVRAGMTLGPGGNELLGYAGILMGGERDVLRPTRTGSLYLGYDLKHYKTEARAQVLTQSLYWAGWVTALALAIWLVFHFLLTRRTARLVHAAEELAEGNLAARSGLRGGDELGRLSRAFDAMAFAISEDIEERKRADEALRALADRGGLQHLV